MPEPRRGDDAMLPIGTRASLGPDAEGRIEAIGALSGERYYWLLMDNGTVAMMPANAVWESHAPEGDTE